jgi:hypothetical protein
MSGNGPDINETHRAEGEEGARRRHDEAWKKRLEEEKRLEEARAEIDREPDAEPEANGGGGPGGPAPKPTSKPRPKPGGPPPSREERLLAELNRDNCVVLDGGKTWVMRFEEVEHAAGGERYLLRMPTFLSFQAFRDFYLNRHISIAARGRRGEMTTVDIDIGSWWLSHSQRRQYDGLVFHPGGERVIAGKLNLWTGWGVEPKHGDWSLMRKHIFDVLANGDQTLFDYIINWSAFAVQHPELQAEAALTFLGGEGTGRGTFAKALCRIFGQHALHISSSDHLTGRFTGHLRQCCFLFADESYAPNDRAAEGRLKRMITEDTITIEAKRKDPREESNRLKVILASNHDWVVPAGAHARRFVVEKVAETYRQKPEWFGPLYQQMHAGGYAAMLYDLQRHKLGDFHPRQIVRTEALAEQQARSLSAEDTWWLELLKTGVLEGADDLRPERATSNRYEVEIIERDGYDTKFKRVIWRDGLYDQARRISPRLKNVADAALGRYLANQGCKGGEKRAVWVHRRRGWQFPPLADCRKKWSERFPDTKWDDTENWTYPEDDPDVVKKEHAADDDPF